MAFLTKISIKTDLNTPLKAKKQYWSIEWTFPDSKKKKPSFQITHRGHTGWSFGPNLPKNGIFDGNTQDNRPKYVFKR